MHKNENRPDAPQFPRTVAAFCRYYGARHKTLILSIIACHVIVVTGTTLFYFLFGKIVDLLMQLGNDRNAVWEEGKTLFILLFLCGVAPDAIASRIRDYVHIFIERNVEYDVRRQGSAWLLGHAVPFYQGDFAGRLADKAKELAMIAGRVADIIFQTVVPTVLTVVFTFAVFLSAHWVFAAALAVWVALYILMIWTTSRRTEALAVDFAQSQSRFNGLLVDIVSNIGAVISFARRGREADNCAAMAAEAGRHKHRYNMYVTYLNIYKELFWQAMLGPLLLVMVWCWQRELLTPGQIAMMIPMAVQIARDVWNLSSNIVNLQGEFGQMQDALDTIALPHAMTDVPQAWPLAVSQGTLVFDRVGFSYGNNIPVVTDMSLVIPAGQRVGLIGPSGAGKSTLVSLLLRFYDPTSGRIEIDGQDIKYTTQDSLRRAVAVIPQDTSLFHRSLRDNIAYGRPEASFDEIVEAARKAHAHDFIGSLPQGYDTMVGERGVKLSGGQRQRIAIARAILKNAPILLLDEATSALDSESEKLIQASLEDLMDGKTVIAIAHRLSTITHLDRLLVMDRGRIVEDGAHQDLVAAGGLYARLWSMQSGGFIGA